LDALYLIEDYLESADRVVVVVHAFGFLVP